MVPGLRPRGPVPVRPLHPPTHSSPCGASGARSAGGFAPRAVWDLGGWVPGITPPVPTPVYPHPVPTRPAPHRPTPSSCTTPRVRGTTGTCTYDRFKTRVGEPRGTEHTRVSGPQAGLYLGDWFTRPFDWFRTRLLDVLLSLVPVIRCFTEFSTRFTELWLRFIDLGPVLLNYGTRFTTSSLYTLGDPNMPSF